jgi:hypothetical protein
MKLFAIIALACLIINGQESSKHGKANEEHPSPVEPSADSSAGTVITVHQDTPERQEDGHPQNPESYLYHLLSPDVLTQIALVIVAIWAICVATRTLGAIKRQGVEMKGQRIEMKRQRRAMIGQLEIMQGQLTEIRRQAKAAEDSLRLMKSKDRAILSFNVTNMTGKPFKGSPDAMTLKIETEISNRGVTRADIVNASFTFDYVDDPDEDPTVVQGPALPLNMPVVVYPSDRGKSESFTQQRLLRKGLEMVQASKYMLFRAAVRYRDVFGDEYTRHNRTAWALFIPTNASEPIEGAEINQSGYEENHNKGGA